MGIKKIFVWLIPICATIALVLYSFGIEQVAFDDKYYRFFQRVLELENEWKFYLPNIPMIPKVDIGVLDFLFGFINSLSTIFNILIDVFNMAVKVLVFLISIIRNAIDGLKEIFIPTIVVSSL